MQMKKTITLVAILCFALNSFSQNIKKDKITSLKVSYLTERLELTPKEAEKFWPIYNKYNSLRNQMKHKYHREIHFEIRKNIDSITNESASKLIKERERVSTCLRVTSKRNRKHKKRIT